MKNCLIIAGEKSGEEHALSFIRSLKETSPNCNFWGVGGDELQNEGMELIYHLKDFSSWGVSEVIGKIPFYFKALKRVEELVEERDCKVAILIDFQDFNLRLAKKLKSRGVKVLYYVAPQAWAWKAYRAEVLERTVHSLFTIIPFEKKWFEDRGVTRVKSVSHPLWLNYRDELQNLEAPRSYDEISKEVNILLLPGSRSFEVKSLLPDFVETIKEIKKNREVRVGLVTSGNINKDFFTPYESDIDIVWENEQLSSALAWADCSLAASGTVTLATALFNVPTVVAYKGSLLNEFIFRTFLSYDGYISLANIVHEQEVFPELLQESVSSYNLKSELLQIIENKELYDEKIKILSSTAKIISGGEFDAGAYMGEVIEEAYNE
ncbi:putative lipid-A-disaccharide synthase [Halobacteriovorax marinus SJ]|uniref:Lipid-A-disaccharide synthase n=1 Tax=Halobacteriovorax marinus (strain ATCC BAA-682 / DSM 15412 / SJ) TaxID=862908 RepID=E1X521_HALMS|nr:lipid-A-disaccharide synthase [Halobacteriovorax marinus]CBW25492.1 putative lipid-A-disaccharide synthase [Halobacteriovorax marinus SJ]